jgi:hypothetical protein
VPQIRLDSIHEMATAIAELYERVDQIEQRSVNIVRGTLRGIRVGRALVDGRAPFVMEDIYLPFVISGLETTIGGDGVSVDVAPGAVYNVERYRQAATVNLPVTGTGVNHTEYVSVTSEGKLVIELVARPAGYLAIADVAVDALGNVTQVVDRRKLDLESGKVFTVDDVVWANTDPPGEPSLLGAFVGFNTTYLMWVNPPDNDLSHVEVWRADNVNDRSQATFIGTATGTRFEDGALGYGDTVYYWIRAVDRAGNVSGWHPSGANAGVAATLKRVDAPDIEDMAVVEAKLDNLAVSTRAIAQNAVEFAKLGTGVQAPIGRDWLGTFHEAEDLAGNTGGVISDATASGGQARRALSTDLDGHMVFGPGLNTMAAGNYWVLFRLKVADNAPDGNVATLECYVPARGVIASRTVKASEFTAAGQWQSFGLTPEVREDDAGVEFRVWFYSGATDLSCDYVKATPLNLVATEFIESLAVTNAKIANLAVDDAKIANLNVSKLVSGTVTALELTVVDDSFVLSSGQQALIVKDKQATPVNRVFIGKLGAGAQDYGLVVRDPTGAIVLQTTGAGTYLSGAFVDSLSASKVSAGTLSADYVMAGTLYTSAGLPRVGVDSGGVAGWGADGQLEFHLNTADGRAYVGGGAVVMDRGGIRTPASGYPAVTMDGGGIAGWLDAGTIRFHLQTATGRAVAGGGAVELDEAGVKIRGAMAKFQTPDGVLRGYVQGMQLAGPAFFVNSVAGAPIGIGSNLTPLPPGQSIMLATPTYEHILIVPGDDGTQGSGLARPVGAALANFGNQFDYWNEVHYKTAVTHTPSLSPSLSPREVVELVRRKPDGLLDKQNLPEHCLVRPTDRAVAEQSLLTRKHLAMAHRLHDQGFSVQQAARVLAKAKGKVRVTPDEVDALMNDEGSIGVRIDTLTLAALETVKELIGHVDDLEARLAKLEAE